MNENKKAEIKIQVEGNDFDVEIKGDSRDVLKGAAAFIHNLAQLFEMHPLEVIMELAGEVEEMDGCLTVEKIHDFSVYPQEAGENER